MLFSKFYKMLSFPRALVNPTKTYGYKHVQYCQIRKIDIVFPFKAPKNVSSVTTLVKTTNLGTMSAEEKHQAIRDLRIKYSTNNQLGNQVCLTSKATYFSWTSVYDWSLPDRSSLSPASLFLLIQLESQNQALKRELKVSVITASHLDKLPEGTSTYESIGKAYFKKPKEDILSDLEKTIEASDEALKSIKAKKETIEMDQQELKKEIAEQINALRKE